MKSVYSTIKYQPKLLCGSPFCTKLDNNIYLRSRTVFNFGSV